MIKPKLNMEVADILSTEYSHQQRLSDERYVPVFKIQIGYKSGHTDKAWYLSFKVNKQTGNIIYQSLTNATERLYINIDEIEFINRIDITFIDKNDVMISKNISDIV